MNPLADGKHVLKVVFTREEIDFELNKVRESGLTIGFVPTMGALHQGHLNLVKRSVDECDFSIASIYVNPTQFNNHEDLIKYPRDIEADSKLLKDVGCDLLFCPTDSVMYPNGFKVLKMDLDGLDSVMEGECRPGHFDGVVTIVAEFFKLIQPHKSYFGEKDYQQLLVVKRVAKSFSRNIEVVPCEIEREESGLAMSSRNRRLSKSQQHIAKKLYEVLFTIKSRIGFDVSDELEKTYIKELGLVKEMKLDYLKILNENTLRKNNLADNQGLRAFVAAEIGGVRLIDNMRL